MSKIALIQNQVTMVYSGKTDVRNLFRQLEYSQDQILLYTAHNIADLKKDLLTGAIGAVIMTSNCLNEKTIKDEIYSTEFQKVFHAFLNRGNGCLVMHQARLAKDQGGYDFLPAPFGKIKAMKREEEATLGDYRIDPSSSNHSILQHPGPVELDRLKAHCLQKKGLYWHYMGGVEPVDWDVLLYDEGDEYVARPLCIVSKPSSQQRMIVTSLNLDWQKETVFFNNLVTYALQGIYTTAVVKDPQHDDIAFEYLLAKLKSEHFRFQTFEFPQDWEHFRQRIRQGAFQTVVSGPHANDLSPLFEELNDFLSPYLKKGEIKLIGIESGREDLKHFTLSGRENSIAGTQFDTEMKVQRELKEMGFVDGSFWMTVDSLKYIAKMNATFTSFNLATVAPLLKKTMPAIVNGSYDGIVSPTTALLWLRAHYLGKDHAETQQTINWLRGQIQFEDEREQLLVYTTFLELDIDAEAFSAKLDELLSRQFTHQSLSEIELSCYLKAALLVKNSELIRLLIEELANNRSKDKLWMDVSLSATISNLLLDALPVLQAHPSETKDIEAIVELMLFDTMIAIQNKMNSASMGKDSNYPWDNTANTTLKCLCALKSLETYMDLPITPITQLLIGYSTADEEGRVDVTAVKVLEVYKAENEKLKTERSRAEEELKQRRNELAISEEEKERYLQEKNELRTQLQGLKKNHQSNKDRFNFFVIAASSWVAFAIILFWSVVFLSTQQESAVAVKDFYLAYKDIINPSFLLVLGFWGVMKYYNSRNGRPDQS